MRTPRDPSFPTALCGVLAVLLLGAPDPARAETPSQAIQRTHARINKLLAKPAKAGSAEEKRLQEQVRKEVNAFLDFEELAKLSLAKHWAARTEAERKEFVGILQDLIERSYTKQLKSNSDYKVEYRKETVKGPEASVVTAVKVTKNKRTTEIVIEYKLRRAASGWMVYDVVTDDVSLVRNYRSQFNRIIRKESYEALVKKMREKLAQKDRS